MKTIYQIRGWICRFFMQYELIAKVILKFGAFLFIFRQIAGWEGFPSGGILNAFSVHMLLALLCVLLPARFVVFFSIGIIIYNIYQVSFWGSLMAAVILLVLYIMIARLCPDETFLMILLPLAMKWNLFMILPLFAGLYMGVFSIIPIVGGVVLWGFLRILPAFLKFNVASIDQLPKAASDTMAYIVDQLVKNENLIFMMIVCSGVVLVVYLLNKISMNYMRYISLAVGTLVGIVCFIVGKVVGMTDLGIFSALLIPVLSLAIMIVTEFFHMALNYQMAQRLAFADDEYYYYVRAIPKILGIRGKTEVKTITSGQSAQAAPEPAATEPPAEESSRQEESGGRVANTTQQIGRLFTEMGGKARGFWNQMKEKQSDKADSQTEESSADEEVVELKIPRQTSADFPENAVTEEDNPPSFNDQLPGPESAEELAKRTGWSDETIKDFFAGLDLDTTEAESDKDPNEN